MKKKRKLELASDDGAFMTRWSFLPENKFFNIHLHKRFANDPNDIHLHDHPYWNMSIILRGGYIEFVKFDTASGDVSSKNMFAHWRKPFSIIVRHAEDAHRIMVGDTCWSIWVTGPVKRRWGFHLPDGWVHWRKYVSKAREHARKNHS